MYASVTSLKFVFKPLAMAEGTFPFRVKSLDQAGRQVPPQIPWSVGGISPVLLISK